ncbi:hypothetical protein [Sinomonas gamaensis]|uniref:hypothetical protein n=1 Tax=Sinomonas gamaensis TaxID=2565624 RepID=UPI001107E43F|nr:hypothetical protein [Sinomonas gamaensis]
MSANAPAPFLEQLWASLDGLRCVVVVGLPGTGKSLLVRELAAAAREASRKSTLLQWDVCRESWEGHPRTRSRYPEVDGVTHEGVRVAMGSWVRGAVAAWFAAHAGDEALLIVEAPHIGGRFSELAHAVDDEAEPHLSAPETAFVVVAPEKDLQLALKQQRAADMEDRPRAGGYEQNNASPDLLDELTRSLRGPAHELGIEAGDEQGYDPDLYAGLMRRVLRHRHTTVVRPDALIQVSGSVYDLAEDSERLWADEQEVEASLGVADAMDETELRNRVENWFRT